MRENDLPSLSHGRIVSVCQVSWQPMLRRTYAAPGGSEEGPRGQLLLRHSLHRVELVGTRKAQGRGILHDARELAEHEAGKLVHARQRRRVHMVPRGEQPLRSVRLIRASGGDERDGAECRVLAGRVRAPVLM